MEISPTGSTFRMKTRFARFQNGQELLRMWSVFADVKTADDLDLPVPSLEQRDDGSRAPSTVPVQPTVELEHYVASLAERAGKVATRQVRPDEDNMLLIATDGRKAALDIRMVIPRDPSGPSKVDVAADAIHRIWERTRDNEYLDTLTGQPSTVRGSLQLVFSDIGTPNQDRWNAYDELRQQLVQRGIPAEQVRYMHEAKTDVEKARLFTAARAGHVAVLIGSTEKMGVGTNVVQARAIALHHLDCPWRPSDIAQRDGRIMRQGNQNEEVAIVRYVTERSFDSYMWQTVERKAASFAQLLRGKINAREIEEIDTSALSAAEAKAIASGNPLLLEHSVILNEVNRLRRLQRAHERNEDMLAHTGNRARSAAERAAADIRRLEAAAPRMIDTSGDRFRITLGTRDYDSRSEAAHALAAWMGDSGLKWLPRYGHKDFGIIGRISSFDIHVEARSGLADLDMTVSLPEVPRSGFTLPKESFLDAGLGLVQRIENRVSGIPSLLDQAREDLEEAEQTVADTQQRLGQPFRHAQTLADAEEDLARVESQLAAMQDEPAPEPAAPKSERVELTVEAVRAYEPNLGSRDGAGREPANPFVPVTPPAAPPGNAPRL